MRAIGGQGLWLEHKWREPDVGLTLCSKENTGGGIVKHLHHSQHRCVKHTEVGVCTIKLWQLFGLNLQRLLTGGKQDAVGEEEVKGRGFSFGAHL